MWGGPGWFESEYVEQVEYVEPRSVAPPVRNPTATTIAQAFMCPFGLTELNAMGLVIVIVLSALAVAIILLH